MTSSLSFEDRVRAGAAYLDEHSPDWVDAIDLSRLNLASSCDCILGQKFGDFSDAASSISRREGLKFDEDDLGTWLGATANWLGDHGFFIKISREDYLRGNCASREIFEEYEQLTEEWRKLIVARRLAREEEDARELVHA